MTSYIAISPSVILGTVSNPNLPARPALSGDTGIEVGGQNPVAAAQGARQPLQGICLTTQGLQGLGRLQQMGKA